jgi:3-hydroxybutyryl-CoA dehydrogenase
MGAGIAELMLRFGCRVAVVEPDGRRGAAARERIAEHLRRHPEPAPNLPPEDLLERLEISAEMDRLRPASLVVEAVPEDAGLKRRVLAAAEDLVSADALIASNTSSLPISDLGRDLRRPELFLGMHFFNPVPRSQLVEIVRGRRTSDAAVERARRWVERVDRRCVVVRDSPGFATSRLGIALGMEAIRMLEEGVATAEDIDTAMVLGYGHPMGPLRLTDLVGLDVRLAIAEHLARTLGERFEPPALLRRLVGEGKLGRKTGQGFYSW